jgi:hypothetical protein
VPEERAQAAELEVTLVALTRKACLQRATSASGCRRVDRPALAAA